jgi:uncharacterized protein YgbK (DUF1537 family)
MLVAIPKAETFAALPPVWPVELKSRVRDWIAAHPQHKLIVLDDDPTGTQTVQNVPVLTVWDVATLRAEFAESGPCFYILTNTRSMVAETAEAVNREIARSLREAAAGQPFTLVSRSDSTLRGHFPLETDVLAEELGPFDATLLIPYFEAGGRYTINDVHYVAEGDQVVPAAETPFARDAVFGYQNSHLPGWVEEKTKGRVKAGEVNSISLELIRRGGPDEVRKHLCGLRQGSVCIANAAALEDIDVLAVAVQESGRRILIRSAAQIVAGMIASQPSQTVTAVSAAGAPLIVVGSYVPKTTGQLTHLLTNTDIARIELRVASLLDPHARSSAISEALAQLHAALGARRGVVLYTSRELVTGSDAAQSLDIGNTVSAALVEIVQRLEIRPSALVAKGGITSSDLATKGLKVRRAIVLGQILPGVPMWKLGAETRFPDMPFIVFPGNVGGTSALTDAFHQLTNQSN